MSTPFFCLGFSKKRKRDTKHKTPHSATPSIDGDGTRRAVFRTRFHERERGEGSRARFREEEEETPLPAPFSSFLLVKVVLLNTKKVRGIDSFVLLRSLSTAQSVALSSVFADRGVDGETARERNRSRAGVVVVVVVSSFSFVLVARPLDDGEKAPKEEGC